MLCTFLQLGLGLLAFHGQRRSTLLRKQFQLEMLSSPMPSAPKGVPKAKAKVEVKVEVEVKQRGRAVASDQVLTFDAIVR